MHVLSPSDTFVVINKTILNDKRTLLINLYQPLIGVVAIGLYNTLWSYLDRLELVSLEFTHNTLLNNMMISCNEFKEAREKLEAIGLIKTYVKEETSVNNYVYELYSPMSAKEFLNNPILNTALENALGTKEFDRTIEYFKVPPINLRNYQDVTSKFSDTFLWTTNTIRNIELNDLKNKNTRALSIISKIDINTILSLIPNDLLNHRSITKDMREYIIKVSFIYNYDNEIMSEIIRNSLTEKKTIDKTKLRNVAEQFYKFENMGKLPSLIYRKQPEYLKSNKDGMSKRDRIINIFETTAPFDFISSKYKTGTPSDSDLKIISYLLLDLDLKPGVVNVLLDYVLKINNNKLTKAFVDTIASQWKKSNIETVEAAMNIAEEEYHKRNEGSKVSKTNSKSSNVTILENKPTWFNQEIEEDSASEEEIRAFEELLKGND